MADDHLLKARGIRKRFGGLVAVDGMDIDVPAGRIVGLIGPNGAGKSTFFNCLSGYYRPDAGQAWFGQQPIQELPMHRTARLGLVRTFQITRALERMSVLDNLMLAHPNQTGERLLGALAWWRTRVEDRRVRATAQEMLDFFGLDPMADQYAGALSGGQKKLLELARALMAQPKMLLLDEPMAGVNPTLARRLLERIQELRTDRGMTFLLVEHDMETVFGQCDQVVVMSEGKKLAEGDPADVKNDPMVQDAYLGG